MKTRSPIAISMLAITLALAFSLTFALAACGKKGNPEPPGPTSDITYPRIYPSR